MCLNLKEWDSRLTIFQTDISVALAFTTVHSEYLGVVGKLRDDQGVGCRFGKVLCDYRKPILLRPLLPLREVSGSTAEDTPNAYRAFANMHLKRVGRHAYQVSVY